jgi:predicted acylesterase/phospholipase RssA
MLRRYFSVGHALNMDRFLESIHWATKGDSITFLEAFVQTGRVLNITINPTVGDRPSVLLNYKTSPNVTIASAVLASSALPGLVPLAQLMEKDELGQLIPFHGVSKEGWRDGSFKTDIPRKTLHLYFRVHFTIVSQVNPHILMFFYNAKGSAGQPSLHRRGRGWRGGFVLTALEHFLKLDMLKWM